MGEILLRHRGVAIVVTLVAIAAAMAIALITSSGDPESGGSVFAPIADAAEKTASYPGAEVKFEGTVDSPALGAPLVMRGHGGFNGQTDRYELDTKAVSGPPGVDLAAASQNAVGEGQVIYMQGPALSAGLPGGAHWMSIDYSQLQSQQTQEQQATGDPRDVLKSLRSMTDVDDLGNEDVAGVTTTHYTGVLDPTIEVDRLREEGDDDKADDVEKILAATGATDHERFDVWVDEQGRVRRIGFEVPFEIIGSGTTMKITMTYSHYGITPSIEVPDPDDVYDGTQLGIDEAKSLGG